MSTPEVEGKGLDYERYALNKLFHRLTAQYRIGSVLEIPATGEKAMPALYSLAFAQAGCQVTLVNAQPKSQWAWDELQLPVQHLQSDNLQTLETDRRFDLVWNFMYLAHHPDKTAMLQRMCTLSKRYVLYIGVNRFNPGFFSHRTVHRLFSVPWNHGDVTFMNPFKVRRFFREQGLNVLRTGLVDTPPYPDSLGFRDMRLHRKNADLNGIDWDSRTVHWMKAGRYPLKLKLLYFFEWLPLPFLIKMFYAHLFFVLAEKPGDGGISQP